MSQARVVVFGYGALVLACLKTLERLGVTPVAVVIPGNRSGSDVNIVAGAVTARGWRLMIQPPRRAIAPFIDEIQRLRPDLLLVWSYSMLLPPELLAIPRYGAVNLHGGLLPEYRGGHVMNWALANGEPETGMTLAFLDEGIDTGPVIAERRFDIAADDDAVSVRRKLGAAGEALLETWWPAIATGTAPSHPQDESRARYYRMRSADDGRIDWTHSAVQINNLVRALVAPWPGAFTTAAGNRIVIRRATPVAAVGSAAPGTVVRADETEWRVAAGEGDLILLAVECDGRAAALADLHRAGFTTGARLD